LFGDDRLKRILNLADFVKTQYLGIPFNHEGKKYYVTILKLS
jgi:hypothetical protein